MGGVVWWMRDAEGRAGAAYMVIGGAGGWVENQSLLRVFRQVAGTPKSSAASNRATSNARCPKSHKAARLRHWLACCVSRLGRGTVIDLKSAPVRRCDLAWQECDPARDVHAPRCLINTTTPAPSLLLQHPISIRPSASSTLSQPTPSPIKTTLLHIHQHDWS